MVAKAYSPIISGCDLLIGKTFPSKSWQRSTFIIRPRRLVVSGEAPITATVLGDKNAERSAIYET